jgi:outer membrane protein OmpA-like peptidoglycan-associated protein
MNRFFVLFFLCCTIFSFAQNPDLKPEDFLISGDTRLTGDNCYQLTYDNNWSSGSIWFKKPIDLTAPFEMEIDVMLGCRDEDGADGIVFVFHPKMQKIGYAGEGMGFAGLRPSIGIEIDTWENGHLLDPPYDHVAILKNGIINHNYNMAGPNKLPNLEDCKDHRIKIVWLPEEKKMTVYVDGRGYIYFKKDIVNKIFRGNSTVYWGVTAGTGGFSNRHAICFEKIDFKEATPILPLNPSLQNKLVSGETITLPSLQFENGQSKIKSSSFVELDRLAKFLQKYPDTKIEVYGFTDSSGSESGNQAISSSRAEAVAKYLISKGISKDRLNAKGIGEAYPVAPNITKEGRLLNRRIEFRMTRIIP